MKIFRMVGTCAEDIIFFELFPGESKIKKDPLSYCSWCDADIIDVDSGGPGIATHPMGLLLDTSACSSHCVEFPILGKDGSEKIVALLIPGKNSEFDKKYASTNPAPGIGFLITCGGESKCIDELRASLRRGMMRAASRRN